MTDFPLGEASMKSWKSKWIPVVFTRRTSRHLYLYRVHRRPGRGQMHHTQRATSREHEHRPSSELVIYHGRRSIICAVGVKSMDMPLLINDPSNTYSKADKQMRPRPATLPFGSMFKCC